MTDAQVHHVERRLAAILAADVAGYSRLMGVDEEGTLARLKEHQQEIVYPKITEHRGRVVKTTGDGILIEFASVVDAVRCAVEVQRGMAERNAELSDGQRMDFRIGINVGDIIIDREDIHGDGVNIAARLEALAEPGGICVSRMVRDQVRDKLDFGFQDLGEQSVKNIARPVLVDRIVISGVETARVPVLPAAAAPAAAAPRDRPRRGLLRPIRRVTGKVIRAVLLLLAILIVAFRWIMPPITPAMLLQLAQAGKLSQRSVPLSAISPELPRALVASEDGQFCRHNGVAWGVETGKASLGFLDNTESITMQLSGSLFLWPGSGPLHKVLEISLAYPIELIWPKRRIMEVYLNTAEWGDGIFGADAAAEAFFGENAAQLSRREAALMVAVLPEPRQASPARPTPYITGRATKISGKMDATRFDYSCLQ